MTTNNQTLVELEKAAIMAHSPGAKLSEARQNAHLTVEDVAARLRLRGSVIEAIEADDYSKISRHVFSRGYLRAYARLVDIDADSIIASFNDLKLTDNDTTRMLLQAPRLATARKENPVKWLLILVMVCSVVFASMWWNADPLKQKNHSGETVTLIKAHAPKHLAAFIEKDSLDSHINSKITVS